ncbi:MAG: aminoglycoside phosphotransferase family protein [Dehalococcoidia bacterium]
MTNGPMHADEVPTSADLARRLIWAQFPQWADLPITPVQSSGTDNAIYRLGDRMAVRLPRRPGAVAQVEKEHARLPWLAPALPLSIPLPFARGQPGEDYPWPWSVLSWLDGEEATTRQLTHSTAAAVALAEFIRALQSLESSGGPAPGAHNSHRGGPLAQRDARVRQAIAECGGLIDTDAATAVWERALAAPPSSSAPVWLHGDLLPSNLLTKGGRLHPVIDFGMLGVGDSACDLLPAWAIFAPAARAAFRTVLELDDAAWERGRGWAMSWAAIALPYYLTTNPRIVEMATHTLRALLADASR